MEAFEVILYKKTAQCSKKERCTVIGGAGGSRTHAPLTRPKAFRVFWYISKLTVFVGKKRKLSEDDSTDLRRKMLKKKSFLTSDRRNSNPFRNAEFLGKMREKQAFLARWRDVGEKNRREKKLNFPYCYGHLQKCVD